MAVNQPRSYMFSSPINNHYIFWRGNIFPDFLYPAITEQDIIVFQYSLISTGPDGGILNQDNLIFQYWISPPIGAFRIEKR